MRRNFWLLNVILLLIVGFSGFCFFDNSSHFTSKVVNYQGNNLRISVNGSNVGSLPTGGIYYLISYQCDNDKTKITWNRSTYELSVTNGIDGGGVSCDLTFESSPKLSSMPVGSYVAYAGSGGMVGSTNVSCQMNGSASSSTASDDTEAPNSCLGQNAREDLDTSGYTYGYCYNENYKFYTTGWRIAYIRDSKVRLVSAGSPECNTRTSSTANVNYIQLANAKALKYCNPNFVDNNCNCVDSNGDGLCDSASADAWAINDTDFYYMTKEISGVGKRLTSESSSLGDVGGSIGEDLVCYSRRSRQECGYHYDLFDNGSYYWFASLYTSSSTDGVYWTPNGRYVNEISNEVSAGLRPVISLSSSVYVTGGSGTMDDPYTIAK